MGCAATAHPNPANTTRLEFERFLRRRNLEEMTWTFMTPMSNYAIGCLMFSVHTIVHSTTMVHLGKFEKEKYFDYILKFKVQKKTTPANRGLMMNPCSPTTS